MYSANGNEKENRSQKLLSPSIHCEVEKSSMSCESDSDLESIPTISHFKRHTWKDSRRINPSDFNESNEIKRLLGNNGEYIEGKWQNNQLTELLSFKFTHPNSSKTVYCRKQSAGYLFTFDEEDFIARVSFKKLEELSFAEPFTVDIKRTILRKLTVIEIKEDTLLNDRNTAYEQFRQLLQNRNSKTADNLEYAEDIFQLSKILEDCRNLSNNKLILKNIAKNKNISLETKSSSQQLFDREKALDVRKNEFSRVNQFYAMDLLTALQQICKDGINNHRSTLYDKYLRSVSMMSQFIMVDHLSHLNDNSIFYIRNKDIELFAELTDMMNKQPFLDFIGDSWDTLFKNIEEIWQHESVKGFAPLTHPIYFYLCKSFQELISEISVKTDISVNNFLKKNEQGKWSLVKTINWSLPTPLNRSLEQQYRFIFKLLEHFKPGYYSDQRKFQYEFKLLQDSNDKTYLQSIQNFFFNLFDNNELSYISQERLTWIYIIDSAITNLPSKEELKLFEPLIQGYIDFIENTEGDCYEKFRVATHNVIRYISQTNPYLSKGVSETILRKQIESIKKAFLDRQSDNFRDLVDLYNEYWQKRESIIEKIPDKFPYGKFNKEMEKISQKLHNIVSTGLDKKARSYDLIQYFRSFNEFLEDLNGVEFSWFVKEINDLTGVELVNTEKQSYQVSDPENFITNHKSIPKHYLIEIIQDLLNSVSNLLKQKKWCDGDNLNAAAELLLAIKKSFLYLKEQPNYVSFDTFKEESTEPFISVVENSSSYEDFKKRINIIGESFWYLRKQDEIDMKKALELYTKENSCGAVEALRDCYNKYLLKFNFYIQETINKSFEEKIKFITEKIKKESKKFEFNKWDTKFKRETLPEILAGLAAVWSIQSSKDLVCIGKNLKPHCIQILCILRLLSVDKDTEGVDKHLAQVLTGQGKSVILGLLSSLLALMSHKVRAVCYSKYLATRDQQDFDSFFKNFGIRDNITYGTFEEMADEVIKPEVNGKRQGLRKLTENRILGHITKQAGQIKQEDISNTILLIDEVDVFFSDQFYGNNHSPCNTVRIPALASIQEKIWEMACKSYQRGTILTEVEEFIKKKIGERNQEFQEFNRFRFKPGKYYLLKTENNEVIKNEYTNQSLYEENLERMINNAICVAKGSDQDRYINKYKMNDDGIISVRSNGIYSIYCYCSYYNSFNYFRLKKKEFDNKDYRNYGYLHIDCGQVSYAKLPEKYPLILGVSGTLTALNEHERKAIRESYNINENSIMPSFFGDSHLKFNPSINCIFRSSEEEWFEGIFKHANFQINLGRSVLIFFDKDIEISKFKEKFLGKFDRLRILTENTGERDKEKYINESGITRTITLATRGMGRGVDFKSSVAVEKNGGVYVIQTFFSPDIKEETQIKGRTARKDNKGGYELILCKKHLISAGFLKDEEITVNYECLSQSRENKMREKGSKNKTRISESESNHNTTMDFLESFFTSENIAQS